MKWSIISQEKLWPSNVPQNSYKTWNMQIIREISAHSLHSGQDSYMDTLWKRMANIFLRHKTLRRVKRLFPRNVVKFFVKHTFWNSDSNGKECKLLYLCKMIATASFVLIWASGRMQLGILSNFYRMRT